MYTTTGCIPYQLLPHTDQVGVVVPDKGLGRLDGEGFAGLDGDHRQLLRVIVGRTVHPDDAAQVDLGHGVHVPEVRVDVVALLRPVSCDLVSYHLIIGYYVD